MLLQSLVEIVFSEFQFLYFNIRTLLVLGFTCTQENKKLGTKCKFSLAGIGCLNQLLSHKLFSVKELILTF